MGRIITCQSCGEEKEHQARGLCNRCYTREWTAKNREHVSTYQRQYRETHLEKRIAYNREYSQTYYERNREKILERTRQTYVKRRNAEQAKSREWGRAHRENKRQAWKRWFSRKRSNTVDGQQLTVKEWQDILRTYDNRCAYCGAQEVELTQDHVIPLSRGGSDSKDNVVPACRSCNCQKSDKTPEEWGRWPSQSP